MLRILFVSFVVVPLIELYVLIEVGSGIGGLATIALCLFTAALGGLIIRIQGVQTLMQARQSMANMQQEKLAEHSAHGLMLALAGILLFFPGFITDILGFLLLIPSLRRMLMPKRVLQGGASASQHETFESAHPERYAKVEIIDVEVIKKD
jgi:UPF0716 protein FxsA